MAGANIKYGNKRKLTSLMLEILLHAGYGSFKGKGATDAVSTVRPAICYKAGVPTSNAAADAPDGLGQLCVDTTNDDVYICQLYTDTTTHTWTKIYS